MSDWVNVGRVYVDAGCIVVGDPFAMPEDGEWSDRLAFMDDELCGEVEDGVVVVSTGLGDGTYDVEVRYEEVPKWGKRVAEMRIVFLTEEMLDIGRKLLDTHHH